MRREYEPIFDYSLVSNVEQPFQVESSALLFDLTNLLRKQFIFEHCSPEDLPAAIMKTGGLPIKIGRSF